MARAITTAANLPTCAQASVDRLKLFGFGNDGGAQGWRFFEAHRLADTARRVQVRDIRALAPQQEVSGYAQAMKRGDQFPPVILTSDGYLIDGSTRTEAARKAGMTVFPAFLLSIVYEDAPEAMRRRLREMGASFNIVHGRRLSASNVTALIEEVTDEDDRPADVARRLSIPLSTAVTAMNAARTVKRATALGLELDGTLTNSHLKMFGGKSEKLTSPVFREVVSLSQDAKLTIPAVTSLLKRVEKAETEQERLDLLRTERKALRDVIETGGSRPSRAARLRQSLGALVNTDDPGLLVELEPAARADHARVLREAAGRLAAVMQAQARLERSFGDE